MIEDETAETWWTEVVDSARLLSAGDVRWLAEVLDTDRNPQEVAFALCRRVQDHGVGDPLPVAAELMELWASGSGERVTERGGS